MTTAQSIVIIGAGRLGTSLSRALGAQLLGGRTAEVVPDNSLCLIAVPDQHISSVARRLKSTNSAFVHLSGAYGLELLAPLSARGFAVGSFHPLQSFPEPRDAGAFKGTFFGIDASTDALLASLGNLAKRLGGSFARIPAASRATYHAAATMAGPLMVALVSIAVREFVRAGLSEEQALSATIPYLSGTISNLDAQRLPGALIGPVRRGDAATVLHHIDAIDSSSRPVYRLLSEEAIDMACKAGLDEHAAEKLRAALSAKDQAV